MSKNLKIALLTISGIVLLGLVAGAGYYLGQTKTSEKQTDNSTQSSNLQNQTTQGLDLKPSIPISKPLFSGKVSKIDKDLELINKEYTETSYYLAGKVQDGKYKDYDRVIMQLNAFGAGGDPFGVNYNIFFTKDYKQFTLINPFIKNEAKTPAKTLDEASGGLEDKDITTASFFSKDKVVGLDTFTEEIPKTIKLNGNFSLIQNHLILYDDEVDTSGNYKSTGPGLDYTKYTKLQSLNSGYNIYYKPYKADIGYVREYDKYILQRSEFIVSDSSGLGIAYGLAYNSSVNSLDAKLEKYVSDKKSFDTYQELYNKTNDKLTKQGLTFDKIGDEIIKVIGKSPDYVDYPIPNTEIAKNDLQNLNSAFTKYSTPFPDSCGNSTSSSTILQNVTQKDLTKISSANGVDIYKLSNPLHPLYKAQYKLKVDLGTNVEYRQDPNATEAGIPGKEVEVDTFTSSNPNTPKPTFEQYVAENPLLFFIDPWDRIATLGEYEYLLPGGCGKPVVYLYPSVPTKVNVKFLANIQLTTDIPKYVANLGWNVLANPNGELQDLQTQYTNCDIFNNSHLGSEYAKNACVRNNYPYLYWSGNRIGAEYPKQSNGWIVEKKDLNSFLNAKLDSMRLNQKERTDMLQYWIPYLSNKSGNYFRVSFLQTKEMNALAPMQITPKPDKVFRIFLDWDNFKTKPDFEIQPQILDKLNSRDGFTVVEWGGLKK